MSSLREACSALWDRINPREPDVRFLATFFATAMVLFLIAYLIGQA